MAIKNGEKLHVEVLEDRLINQGLFLDKMARNMYNIYYHTRRASAMHANFGGFYILGVINEIY